MGKLAMCYYHGQGVTADPAQANSWLQTAVDLGDLVSQATLGGFLVQGDARAGVVRDAARGLEVLREAVEQGFAPALIQVALCYLRGEGAVEKDAVHGAGGFGSTRPLLSSTRAVSSLKP